MEAVMLFHFSIIFNLTMIITQLSNNIRNSNRNFQFRYKYSTFILGERKNSQGFKDFSDDSLVTEILLLIKKLVN